MNDRLNVIWNDPRRTPVLIGLVAFNVGVGVGYFLGLRKKKIKILATTDQLKFNVKVNDLEEIRVAKQEKVKTVEDIKAEFEALKAKGHVAPKITTIELIEEEPVELVTRSIFQEDEWDVPKELSNRTTDEPYVLHREEFFSEETPYTQKQYTYYAGDSILCDEDNSPVYNHAYITGELKFGHGSGDPDVVYIRNDKRKEEYEVNLDQGLYSTEVLGLEIEDNTRARDLRHTSHRRIRQGDDE